MLLRFLCLFLPLKATWIELFDGKVILRRIDVHDYSGNAYFTYRRSYHNLYYTDWSGTHPGPLVKRSAAYRHWWKPIPPPKPDPYRYKLNIRAMPRVEEIDGRFR